MTEREQSGVWMFFTESQDSPEMAICNICNNCIRRAPPGAPRKKCQTSSMWCHLKSIHKDQYTQALEKKYETCRKRKRMEEENTNRANIYVLDPRVRQETLEQTLERTRK